MNRRLIFYALFLLFAPSIGAQQTAFVGVTVVDVRNGKLHNNQTVCIKDGIISYVGPKKKLPKDTKVINAQGKYMMPGLWDMHVHTTSENSPATEWPLLIAYGVTGVRDMGGHGPDLLLASKTRLRNGAVGPRIYGAGKILDGKPEVHTDQKVNMATTQEAMAWVARMDSAGMDFIKGYEMLKPDVLEALALACRQKGLKLAGHVPLTVTLTTAAKFMNSMEHLRGFDYACSSLEDSIVTVQRQAIDTAQANGAILRAKLLRSRFLSLYNSFDTAKALRLMRSLADNNVYQCPTLSVGATPAVTRFDTTASFVNAFQFLHDTTKKKWTSRFNSLLEAAKNPANFSEMQLDYAFRKRMVKMLAEQGVPLLAGTDLTLPMLIAGQSLHQELRLLAEAGLSPLQVIQAATINPVKWLGLEKQAGTVARGKWADLLLLAKNPLEQIANTETIEWVVANGKVYNRAELDSLLRSINGNRN
ncbi:MAG TPA: amidohydrolase family protein [Flavisolibacter sp.]|nr:amidohydrolase family protein [Flavisolibacter sp.]